MLGPDGSPAPGATVHLCDESGSTTSLGFAGAEADGMGKFNYRSLGAGVVHFIAKPRGPRSEVVEVTVMASGTVGGVGFRLAPQ